MSVSDDVRRATGINAARCYQCAKCSAGCPMAAETALRPHDLLRLVQRDQRARVLDDEAIWLCLGCETCSSRCPNDVDPARVIDALRALALAARPGAAARAVRAFHDAFLGEIRRNGRVHEIGLVAGYKVRTLALLQDAASAPGLFARGKLPLRPAACAGKADVRRIIDACAARTEA